MSEQLDLVAFAEEQEALAAEAVKQRPEAAAAPVRVVRSVDDTEAILALVAGDPVHAGDRARIVAAILADGAANGGVVNPNRVRDSLTGEHGLDVYPRVIGATYSALRRTGVLELVGRAESTDLRGRNRGKDVRLYRLTSRPVAA